MGTLLLDMLFFAFGFGGERIKMIQKEFLKNRVSPLKVYQKENQVR